MSPDFGFRGSNGTVGRGRREKRSEKLSAAALASTAETPGLGMTRPRTKDRQAATKETSVA